MIIDITIIPPMTAPVMYPAVLPSSPNIDMDNH